MKAYIKNKSKFDYPEEMEKILDYLNKWGNLNISAKEVEELYREYSEEVWCAGWIEVHDHILPSFADWLSEVEV